ncbi:unnamed protein product, partial [Amoebophrya sp. A25]
AENTQRNAAAGARSGAENDNNPHDAVAEAEREAAEALAAKQREEAELRRKKELQEDEKEKKEKLRTSVSPWVAESVKKTLQQLVQHQQFVRHQQQHFFMSVSDTDANLKSLSSSSN